MKYPEINRFGLTEYHKERLCYPYTDAPAFTFWEPPQEGESMRAWQDGGEFKDLLLADGRVQAVIGRREIENVFRLENFLENVDYIFERTFGGKAGRKLRSWEAGNMRE